MYVQSTFRYPRLDLATKSIRAIQILPGAYDDSIQCTMSVIKLRGNHTAVSYAWGSDDVHHQIEINGHFFHVRKNLHDFLLHARRYLPDQTFWVDAICIDQRNTAEKNHQVRHMVDIYKLATLVVTWLGCGHSRIMKLIDSVIDINRKSFSTHMAKLEWDDWITMEEDIILLCNLEYWSRLWVVPEMFKARKLMIMLGSSTLPWFELVSFIRQVCEYSAPSDFKRRDIAASHLSFSALAWEEDDRSPRFDLQTLLKLYGSHKCSDVRDRIFALIPLASDSVSSQIDYSLTMLELFMHLFARTPNADWAQLLLEVLSLSTCKAGHDSLFTRILRDDRHMFVDLLCGKHHVQDVFAFSDRLHSDRVELYERSDCVSMGHWLFGKISSVPTTSPEGARFLELNVAVVILLVKYIGESALKIIPFEIDMLNHPSGIVADIDINVDVGEETGEDVEDVEGIDGNRVRLPWQPQDPPNPDADFLDDCGGFDGSSCTDEVVSNKDDGDETLITDNDIWSRFGTILLNLPQAKQKTDILFSGSVALFLTGISHSSIQLSDLVTRATSRVGKALFFGGNITHLLQSEILFDTSLWITFGVPVKEDGENSRVGPGSIQSHLRPEQYAGELMDRLTEIELFWSQRSIRDLTTWGNEYLTEQSKMSIVRLDHDTLFVTSPRDRSSSRTVIGAIHREYDFTRLVLAKTPCELDAKIFSDIGGDQIRYCLRAPSLSALAEFYALAAWQVNLYTMEQIRSLQSLQELRISSVVPPLPLSHLFLEGMDSILEASRYRSPSPRFIIRRISL